MNAAEFFRIKRLENPELYAEVCKRYPVQSQYSETRDKYGRSPNAHSKGNGRYPSHLKRKFTDEEWGDIRKLVREGRRELAEIQRYAMQLVNRD